MNTSTYKTQSTLSYSLEGTHTPKQSTLTGTRVNTCTHRSSIFNKQEKYNSSNSIQTAKIPTHEHLYSDQYHIISIANPHIKR